MPVPRKVQRIQLRMLALFHSVMLQETPELVVHALHIAATLGEVALRHPLDMQDGQRDSQGMVRQHRTGDSLGWTDHITTDAKPVEKFFPEALEQLNVLGFLGGKFKQGACSIVIFRQRGARMVQHKRQNEIVHQLCVVVGKDNARGQASERAW